MTEKKPIRKTYIAKLVGRILVLIFCFWLYFARPDQFNVLEGMNFFNEFSVLHILWIIWIVDMALQLIPVRNKIPLGSQKLFKMHFRLVRENINYHALRKYTVSTTKAAYKVFVMWTALIACIGLLHWFGILTENMIFIISVFFYVCDLICVLIWCPFRLLMKTKCCTTCRIFNWDHLMMFTPFIFVSGFYSWSLLLLSIAVWLVWELCIMMFPERFWEITNTALRCSNCTDKLCTQYCQKLR